MPFSEKEKDMKRLYKKVFTNGNGDGIYVLTFSNGDTIEVKADVWYETDNGLDENDVNYEEYQACAVEIMRILVNKSKTFKEGSLIEISYHNFPLEIKDSHGERI